MASLHLLLVLAAVISGAAADYAMEGESYSLKCEIEGTVQYWMLHGSGAAYMTGDYYDQPFISVESDGVLHFNEVKKEHEGDHLCVTTVSGNIRGASVSMKVRPKPSRDLWEDMYKAQFSTGLIAALVCAVLFTTGCLVFRFRYRAPKSELLNGSAEEGGHFNPALDVDLEHTKM